MGESVPSRADYGHFTAIDTRWADNDLYGHVNNVAYYAYFDTAVNRYLIAAGGLDIHTGDTIGVVVESECRYRRPLAFPDQIEAGLRVEHLGRRAVTYGVGIFREDEPNACAHGRFVHVFIDRTSRQPVPMPQSLRTALARLVHTRKPAADC